MTSFDEDRFRQDYKKQSPKAINYLINYLQGASSPVSLPVDLFNLPSPSLLLSIDLKLLVQLERILAKKMASPQLRFFVQIAHQYKRLYHLLEEFISEIDFEELLIYCGYFYEWRRYREGITMYDDPNTIDIINSVLNRKIGLLNAQRQPLSGSVNCLTFDMRSSKLLQRILSDVKLKKRIINFFGKVDIANHLVYLMEWTLQMNLQISLDKKGIYQLSSPDDTQLIAWKTTDLKYKARQDYYLNLSGQKLEGTEEQILNSSVDIYTKAASIRMWSNQYKFFRERFPEHIQFEDGRSFYALHFFNLLNSLSQHSNSRWNHLIEGQMVQHIEMHEAIYSTMIENSLKGNDTTHVFSQDYASLLTTFSNKIDEEEAQTILYYLVHDFQEKNKEGTAQKIDLNLRPIMRIGKVLYWLPGILANNDYATVLQNRLFLGSLENKTHSNFNPQFWSESAPKYISEMFEKVGYKHILTEKKYKDKYTNKKSDIDLAIYEDGYLFIFEIKFTYGRSRIKEIFKHTLERGRSLQKAFTQIENHLAYLSKPENLNGLLKNLNVKGEPIDVKIIPVILDNTFEMDGPHDYNGIQVYKISDLELEVILENKLIFLLDQNEIMQRGNRLSEYSLWDGDRCHPADLLNNIQLQRVWKNLIGHIEIRLDERQIRTNSLAISYKA